MKRILLDTISAGYFINKRHGLFERARAEAAKGRTIGIAIPVLAELVAGIENSQSRERNMKRLMASLGFLKIWPMDYAAAFEYERLFAELTRLGRPIGALDRMIAAIALTLGNCTVVSTDSDMRAVPGLHVEDWRS